MNIMATKWVEPCGRKSVELVVRKWVAPYGNRKRVSHFSIESGLTLR